jgi:hypothetical protein
MTHFCPHVSCETDQYLFDNTTPLADLGGLTEFQYLQTHFIYTDHTQILTGSAGLTYLWNGTRFSTDMFYGSGLRSGDANISHEQPYAQFNVGMTHEFTGWNMKPLTLRFLSRKRVIFWRVTARISRARLICMPCPKASSNGYFRLLRRSQDSSPPAISCWPRRAAAFQSSRALLLPRPYFLRARAASADRDRYLLARKDGS